MITFCDIETSDLLKPELAPDHDAQPWPVSIAARLVGFDGKARDFFRFRVRSEGRVIKDAATAVHGITSRQAARTGTSEVVALGALIGFVNESRYVVGFNLDFERDVITNRLERLGKTRKGWLREGVEHICVMKAATNVCKIEPEVAREDQNYKWPRLDQACQAILGEPPREGHHDCWDDCARTERLFWRLQAAGIIHIPELEAALS